MDYDVNAPYCITPCNPAASGSACGDWTRDLSRVEITTTKVANRKKFRLELVEQETLFGPCYYYRVYAAADSGCLATKPYWATFVDRDNTADLTISPDIAYFKWHLNPENLDSIIAIRAAAFAFPGLDSGLDSCTSS